MALLGCQDPQAAQAGVAVRDSVGIHIVENHQPQRDSVSSWVLSDEPGTVIGSATGEGAQSLFRVVQAIQLQGDLIAVIDGASQEIRVFDVQARHVRTFGGQGGGPGRFEGLAQLFANSDSIIAFDRRTRAVTVLALTDDVVWTRAVPNPAQRSGVSVLGRLPDGSFLTRSGGSPMGADLEGVIQTPEWISRWDQTGEVVEDIVESPGPEMVAPKAGAGAFIMSRPLGRQSFYCLAGDRVVVSYTEHFELRYYDTRGQLLRIARKIGEAEALTEDDIREYMEGPQVYISGRPVADLLSSGDFPPTKPAHGGLACDAEGNVWVRAYRQPNEEGPENWSVFDADGRWITDVRTPASLRVTDLGRDYVLGLTSDESDVEYIVRYDLLR